MPPPGETFEIDGPGGALSFTPFLQHHGEVDALGFRCGPIAYSSDVVGLPEESFEVLEGVECWIVDALRRKPHISHAHLDLTLEWLARVKPKIGILTNLHIDMDYRTLERELPEGVIPAYDGLQIQF
jgi:phosphoribosyl 1,2-cyclic phosphate phosphodiesterase